MREVTNNRVATLSDTEKTQQSVLCFSLGERERDQLEPVVAGPVNCLSPSYLELLWMWRDD